MTGWAADFSYSYFRKGSEIIRSDFEPRLLGDAARLDDPGDKKIAFVRHDVDVDLSKAFRMAQIEREHDVPASYMIMNASLMYSLRAMHRVKEHCAKSQAWAMRSVCTSIVLRSYVKKKAI